jgi:hypothetical protein
MTIHDKVIFSGYSMEFNSGLNYAGKRTLVVGIEAH